MAIDPLVRSRLHGLGAALLLCAPCGAQGSPASGAGAGAGGAATGGPTAEERAGHERMVRLLAELAARNAEIDTFVGDGPLKKLEADLAAVPDPSATPKLVARLRYDIGINLMRLGRADEARASLLEAEHILASLSAEDQPDYARRLPYDLGISCLRIAENRNCVAHHAPESCILPIEGAGVHVDPEPSREALRWFRAALARSAGDESLRLSALWLLDVASMSIGEYPQGLAEDELIPPEVFRSKVEFPRFHDVAREVGLAARNLSGGAITDDFDGDGLYDVVTSSWNLGGPLRFFHNQGDGTFADRSHEAGLDGIVGGLNIDHADFDDDGDLDVLVPRGAWLSGEAGRQPKSLLRNDGGRFLDVTFRAGLAEPRYPSQSVDWADVDLDGDLDLYVGNESSPTERNPSQLFLNAGDGTFQDVAPAAGVTNLRFAKGVVFGDVDEDRYPDLYISNAGNPNRLYHNERDLTFKDVANERGVTGPIQSFPTWFFDFDNDGHLDLFVSSYYWPAAPETPRLAPVVASYLGLPLEPFGAEPARFYKGDGHGGFVDVAARLGVTQLTLPMGSNFGDLDNDGFPDVYLGTGYPYYDGLVPNVMYWNRGGTSFADVTFAGGFGHLQKGHGVAFADLDGDGDQDVFEEMGGGYPGDAFTCVLYENPGFGNHWLEVRLVGTESNRFGVGARLRAEIVEDGVRRSVYRDVDSGSSFGSNSFVQHLGLGRATRVELLEVSWPKTGKTQTFRELAVDRRIALTEGAAEVVEVPLRAFRFKSAD